MLAFGDGGGKVDRRCPQAARRKKYEADELAWKNWYFVSCFYGFMMNTENLLTVASFPLLNACLLALIVISELLRRLYDV